MTLRSERRGRAGFARLLIAITMCLLGVVATQGSSRADSAVATFLDGRLDLGAVRTSVVTTGRYRATFPTTRQLLESDAGLLVALPPVLAVGTAGASAIAPVPLPVTFMLHGMCGQPAWSCHHMRGATGSDSWLACPSGNVPCGDFYDWKGDGERKAAYLDGASDLLRTTFPELVTPQGNDVLVGFSRGAFVARDVAYARPGRFVGLVLIGAAMLPDPKRLRENGIRRVVLASGDFDGARPTMVKATAKLILGGVEARFVSTGRIYHQLPSDIAEVLAPHIAWVRSAPPAPEATATASI